MADTCATFTFGSLTINGDLDQDGLVIDEDGDVQGLDGAPITGQIDPKGAAAGASGSIVQNKALRGRVVVFTGIVHIGTLGENANPMSTAYRAKVCIVEKAAVAACEAQLNSATNLSWTEADGDARSLSCTYGTEGGEIRFSGPMHSRRFTLTLVSEDANIS